MKTEPLISIISIFYNSAEYVRKNVDSIRSQKNVNLEIILVDDCSSDNTRSILKEYASIDSRIKLIFHDENKGISEARNSGIKAATGDCFYFIDGDDFLTHSRSLATLARHWTVDMDWVAGSYEVVDENGRIVRKILLHEGCYRSKEAIRKHFGDLDFIYIHNRLINARFKDVLFPARTIHEDRFWNVAAYSRLSSVLQLKDVTYSYFARTSSFSSTTRFNEKFIDDAQRLLEQMTQLDAYWMETARGFTVSLIKALYLGNSPVERRSAFLAFVRDHNLYYAGKNVRGGVPRITKTIYWMTAHGVPDSIIKSIAWLYKWGSSKINRPI